MMRPSRSYHFFQRVLRHIRVPVKLILITESKSSGFILNNNLSFVIPALLTKMWIGPTAASASKAWLLDQNQKCPH